MKHYIIFICIFFIISCGVNKDNIELELNSGNIQKTQLIEKHVIWNSMEPLIKNGENVIFQSGYYDDKNILKKDIKWDVVLYDFKWEDKPIIKKIVATDKDILELKNNTLFVNDQEIKNSVWDSYDFTENEQTVLKMYISKDNKIPKNSVFILWDNTQISTDSRKFGAVSLTDILWKVILKN